LGKPTIPIDRLDIGYFISKYSMMYFDIK
jgi:hypothetical protein